MNHFTGGDAASNWEDHASVN